MLAQLSLLLLGVSMVFKLAPILLMLIAVKMLV